LDTLNNRIRTKLRYQLQPTHCGNCKHSKDWDDADFGKCSVLAGIIFTVMHKGICKLHSAFNGGNIHYGNTNPHD